MSVMTNAELAQWVLDHRHSPSGYPDGSVIWRVNLSNEKVDQIVTALRSGDRTAPAEKAAEA